MYLDCSCSLYLLDIEHQLVVNVYRDQWCETKHKVLGTLGRWVGQRPNSAHEILRRLVLAAEEQQTCEDESNKFFELLDSTQQASFLTALEDICIHSSQMEFDSDASIELATAGPIFTHEGNHSLCSAYRPYHLGSNHTIRLALRMENELSKCQSFACPVSSACGY